jgi:hypothetical protein
MCVRQYGYRGEEEEKKRGWAETNLFNDKLGSLGILLSNLFLLDGGSELLSETIRYGDNEISLWESSGLHSTTRVSAMDATHVMCV